MSIHVVQLFSLNSAEANQITALSTQLGYTNSPEALLIRTTAIVRSPNDCLFVAKSNNEIIGWAHGFVALRVETPLFVEIAGLVVDIDHYKKGIGKHLVNAVAEWGKNLGISKLRIRCNVMRTQSHEFYRKIGLKESKRQVIFELDS